MRFIPATIAAAALAITGGALPHIAPATRTWEALAALLLITGVTALAVIARATVRGD